MDAVLRPDDVTQPDGHHFTKVGQHAQDITSLSETQSVLLFTCCRCEKLLAFYQQTLAISRAGIFKRMRCGVWQK
jgi:hypothetical protein